MSLKDKLDSIKLEKDTKIVPGNIKSGVTILGVQGSLAPTPDGVFIQDTQPTKTTSEAMWLKEEGIETSALIPTTFKLNHTYYWSDALAELTEEQLESFNNSTYHLFICPTKANRNHISSGFVYAFDDMSNFYLRVDGDSYTVPQRGNIVIKAFSSRNYGNQLEILENQTGIYENGIDMTLDTNIWSDFSVYDTNDNLIHLSDITEESGLHIDVDDKRYIVHQSKSGTNTFTKILDTSDADAVAGNILSGKTAYVNNTKVTGNMTNNGALSITPSTSSQSIPAGYTSGGTVSGDANLVQANIRAGVSIFGVQGNLEPDKPDQTKTCTPSASQQVIEPDTGYELASVTVNPIPLNIYCQLPTEGWSTDIYTNIPYNFYYGSTALVGTDIYLFSNNYYANYNTAYKYDTVNDTYTQLTDIPFRHDNGVSIAIGTDIYIFGGGDNSTTQTTAYKYDTLTDTYTQLTSIPYRIYQSGITSVGTDIYLFGGSNAATTAYKYDTLTDTYTQLTNIPYSFYGNSITAVGTNIYLFGSSTISAATTAYKYDTLTDTYTQLTNIPYQFYYASIASVNTTIYLFGGQGSNSNFYKYDTLTDTYTQLANISPGFVSGGAVSINTDIYLLGGTLSSTTIRVYDTYIEPTPKQGLWLKQDLTPSAIITDDSVTLVPYWDTDLMSNLRAIPYNFQYGSAASVGTDIYLFGGNANSVITYKYDTLTDTYTRLTDIPYYFYNGGACAVGTDIYLLGSNETTERKKAYKYDTLTDTYTQLTDIPYAFYQGGTVSIGTNIYLFGGNGGSTTVYKYDTLTDTYTQLANIPNTFASGSAVSVGTDIYLFGDYNRKTTAYKYDTLTDTYTQLANIPYNFYSGSITVVGTDIYIFGGSGNTSSNSDITTYKYDTLTDTYTQLANIPYKFSYGFSVLVGTDIYLLGGSDNPTKVQVFTFPVKSYTNNSIIIENGNTYLTELIPTSVTNGLKYKFNNFYYYTTQGGLDNTIEKYYGNGTNWIQIT